MADHTHQLVSNQHHAVVLHGSKSTSDLEHIGRQIYRENPILRDVAVMMEHPEFRSLYTKYFTNFDDMKVFVALLKTYEMVDANISTTSYDYVNGYHKIALMKKLLEEQPEIRRQISESMNKWVSVSKQPVGLEDKTE